MKNTFDKFCYVRQSGGLYVSLKKCRTGLRTMVLVVFRGLCLLRALKVNQCVASPSLTFQ